MTRYLRTSATIVGLIGSLAGGIASAQDKQPSKPAAKVDGENYDRLRTGDSENGKIVVPTNQVLSPAGRQVAFSGRPTDVGLSSDGRGLAVLERGNVMILDPVRGEVVSKATHANGSFGGIVFAPDGKRVLASNIRGTIGVFEVEADGDLKAQDPI